MQVLLISSSPHKEKSKTFTLAQELLKGLEHSGCKTEIIHLSDANINFCRHCEECHRQILHCLIKDSTPLIIKKMLEADGIILASPNYINQVNAPMKALFDRSTHLIHCKRLLGKYIAAVVTSGSGDAKAILDYIRHYANVCGAQYSGGVSARERLLNEKIEEAYHLGKKLASDIKKKSIFSDQMSIIEAGIEHFKKLIQRRREDWKEEYVFWQGKGWL